MPKVGRSRVIEAAVDRTWELVSDPHHLARWWPLAQRVEDVRDEDGELHWTLALRSDRGTQVRADYSGRVEVEGSRFAWTQQLAGTPFERILRSARVEIDVGAAKAPSGGSRVSLLSDERLRGLSRLGAPMMRGAARRRLDEALENLDRALAGGPR
jgi:carbon monoxide dehydrogenase subunit G